MVKYYKSTKFYKYPGGIAMKKTTVIMLMVFFIINSSLTSLVEANTLSFTDIKSGHWAYNSVHELTQLGYIKGYPDGTFKPNNNITRAEFSAIMSKLVNDLYPDGPNYDNSKILKDLNPSHWSYNAANHLLSHIPGEDAAKIFGSTFSADKKITREEVVAVVHAIIKQHADFSGIDLSKYSFTDLKKARFPESIRLCAQQGLIAGYPDGSFRPAGNISRAEIAAILVKVIRG